MMNDDTPDSPLQTLRLLIVLWSPLLAVASLCWFISDQDVRRLALAAALVLLALSALIVPRWCEEKS